MAIVKTYKLFLDDIRSVEEAYSYTRFEGFKSDDWTIVRNYNDFVATIKVAWEKYGHFPEIIAFDHDLADEHYGADINNKFNEKTGMDCAKWLVDFCIDNKLELPDWVTHSMNPAGRDNINLFLNNYLKHQKNGN